MGLVSKHFDGWPITPRGRSRASSCLGFDYNVGIVECHLIQGLFRLNRRRFNLLRSPQSIFNRTKPQTVPSLLMSK